LGLSIPTGGGIVARTLWAALKAAVNGNSAEISESELSQIARVVVLGKDNNVTISGPAAAPAENLDLVIARCFDVALHQPGLSVVFAISGTGERLIRIENIGDYRLPEESQLVVHESKPRAEIPPPPEVVASTVPDKWPSKQDDSSVATDERTYTGTAKDYVEYAQYLMGLPEREDGNPEAGEAT
jgi:hypothetical protein